MHIKSEHASVSMSLNETLKHQKPCFALISFLIQNLISFLQFRALHFHAFMHKHDHYYFVMIINEKMG